MTKEETPTQNEQKVDPTWDDDFPPEKLTIPYGDEETEAQDQKEEEIEEESEDKKEVPQAQPVESVVTVEDPGEFIPEDLSFEYDIEGKKFTIASSEDIDKIPDEEKEKLSASQIVSLLNKANRIDSRLSLAKEAHEAKVQEYNRQLDNQKEQEETIANFAAEFDYLVDKGFVPAVPDNLRDADWSDDSVNSQEGVKEQKEILDYMIKENAVRSKAGIKPLTSIVDAFNALQFENKNSREDERDKKEKQARKDAGARISGGTNNNALSPVPRGIAVGRVNAFNRNTDWEN